MMNYILFGPPGMGKSTLIGILKTKGIGALDLEDLHPNRIRFQIPAMVKDKILGGADLNPKRNYNGCRKVLLIADQRVYDYRRHLRDSKTPGKKGQAYHNVEDWTKGVSYDYVIDTSKLNAEETALRLISILKKGR